MGKEMNLVSIMGHDIRHFYAFSCYYFCFIHALIF